MDGRMIFQNIWNRLAENERAVAIRLGLTPFAPLYVVRMMYQTAARNTTLLRNASPVPKSRMRTGIKAAVEVTTNILTQGRNMASDTLERPMATPMGIPMKQARRNPIIIWRREVKSSAS